MHGLPSGGSEVKLDVAATWLRSTTVWSLVVMVVAATLIYERMNSAINRLQDGQASIVTSVGDMRNDLRSLVAENIAQRQFQSWLELLRALNKDLKVPDMPR